MVAMVTSEVQKITCLYFSDSQGVETKSQKVEGLSSSRSGDTEENILFTKSYLYVVSRDTHPV